MLSGVVLLGLICVAVWWLRRAQPQVAVPPEVQARQALELLRNQPEDGVLLSRASQMLRRYIIQAFDLPPNELTTTEFCDLIAGSQAVGSQFSAAISEFLRRCDQRKFAPSADPQPLDGVAQALKLIELGEARRAELRQANQTSEAVKQ